MDDNGKGCKRTHKSNQHSPSSPKQVQKRPMNPSDKKSSLISRSLQYDLPTNVAKNSIGRMNPIHKFASHVLSSSVSKLFHPNHNNMQTGNSRSPLSDIDQNRLQKSLDSFTLPASVGQRSQSVETRSPLSKID